MRCLTPLWVRLIASFGFVMLYVPLIIMVCFSFNSGKLSAVWSGFSVKWYISLFDDKQLIEGITKSIFIASISATLSLILGTFLAFALTKIKIFNGRKFLAFLSIAPIVMPEVVIGLSLLLFFIALEVLTGWPTERGLITIILSHATFGMCFVALVIQARLSNFEEYLIEVASDLGADFTCVFFTIILPLISQSLIAGWLLSFAISFDDLIIASFVSGPGSSTLPIIIFSKIRLGVSPDINALATIIIIVVSIMVMLITLLLNQKK